jgi:hypothetical protein
MHKRGWEIEHIIDKGKVWVPKWKLWHIGRAQHFCSFSTR